MTDPHPPASTSPLDAQDDSPRERRMKRSAWHRKASKPVTLWMGALLLVSLIHWALPDYRWVLIHMFTLGILTNSIMLWSQHFTEKFLHQQLEESTRKGQLRRFLILNVGIIITIVGQLLEPIWDLHWIITCIGATLVGGCLAYHTYYLGKQYLRAPKGQRYSASVLAYIASSFCLPFGALAGALMAVKMPDEWQDRLRMVHLALNLLGFVGFAAVGSLTLLFATVWRTKSGPQPMAHILTLMGTGLVGIVTGALLNLPFLAGIGLVLYIAGLILAANGWFTSVREVLRDPRDRINFASVSVAAAPLWLIGALCVLAYRTFTASSITDIRLPTMAILIGFAAQLLIGVMSYLLPSNIGGGPAATRTGMIIYNRAGLFRSTMVNLALPVWLYTDNSWLRIITAVLSMGSLACFFFLSPIAVRAQLGVIRKQREPLDLPPSPQWGQVTAAVAVLALVLAGTTAVTGSTPSTTTNSSEATAGTGEITNVTVDAKDMRFTPDTISVPTGNELHVTLVNSAEQAHDLKFANGATTGRVQPGEKREVNVGVIDKQLEGWCTIAGHKQQGMTLTVTPEGTNAQAAETAATQDTNRALPAAADTLNPDNFVDPNLAATPNETVHKVTMEATDTDVAIGDKTTRGRWEFNGGVQGPTLRGQVGDTFEITFRNNGTMEHSLDFHAGQVSPDEVMKSIAPGESLVYRFTATHAGAWLYHCGTAPVSTHIAAGMFGAVIIDPPNLAPVDHEYVLIQSEVYGINSTSDNPVDSALLAAQTPSAVVFNGIENQYVAKPIGMKTGDTARFWVVNAGPNKPTSFHIIGAQFTTVYKEGAYLLRPGSGASQVLDLSAAQGGFVETEFPEAGTYTFLNHQLSDAEKGAIGTIIVD